MARQPRIFPVLRYNDAPASIAWLCRVLGFRVHARFDDPGNANLVVHAELALGSGLVMISSITPTPFSDRAPMISVAEAGGVTQSIYVVLDEVARHAATAAAAGADIFQPLEAQPHGGTSYSVRDPEGHVWTFGSYDPDGNAE